MKTFDKKDVFTLVTAEEAKAYIDKQGYFGDSFKELEEDIEKGWSRKLKEVFPDRYTSIVFRSLGSETSYGLFLPTDKLKEVEEKKYRPFKDFEELSETLNKGVGSEIMYRLKKVPLRKITTSIIGYITEDNREDLILIGMSALSLSTYFEEIEIWNNVEKQWKPFGVEE